MKTFQSKYTGKQIENNIDTFKDVINRYVKNVELSLTFIVHDINYLTFEKFLGLNNFEDYYCPNIYVKDIEGNTTNIENCFSEILDFIDNQHLYPNINIFTEFYGTNFEECYKFVFIRKENDILIWENKYYWLIFLPNELKFIILNKKINILEISNISDFNESAISIIRAIGVFEFFENAFFGNIKTKILCIEILIDTEYNVFLKIEKNAYETPEVYNLNIANNYIQLQPY